jgi:RNA-directed DNA polymerase
VMIPKPNGGGERPLGIPTIRDRVVQTAAKLVLEPIFEADFEDNAYGYRPARGAVDAVKDVHRHLCRGYADVVDADLSRYLDPVSYCPLVHEAPSNSSL